MATMSELIECPPYKKFSVRFSNAITSVFSDADEQHWETIQMNQESDVSKPVKYRVLFMDSAQQQHMEIPASIMDLKDLEELHLETNHIEVIPKEISHFHNIKVLYLNNNNIIHICEELGKLKNLQSLDLSSNPLHNNSLDVISNISQLRELRLYNINLEEFPVQLCKHLHHLQLLGLSNNRLKTLPPEITPDVRSLENLSYLGITGNRFAAFPEEVLQLEYLEKLYIGQDHGVQLSCLPDNIFMLKNLKELYIENNNLEFLPSTLNLLHNLEVLDCHNNNLKKLPDNICQLHALQKLLLQKNQLTSLPDNLDMLHKLDQLLLDGNPLVDPPVEVCSLGKSAVLQYLKEKRQKHAFATKIQALWRGIMVRKGLGPFAYLLQTGKKGKKSKKEKKGKSKGNKCDSKGKKK